MGTLGGDQMKVLVACEYSGTVRDAFIKNGHDAMSCDLEPTEVPGPHYQGNVMDVINQDWDLMIAFPPCTHLAVSGARHFVTKKADGRQQQGIKFFLHTPQIKMQNPPTLTVMFCRQKHLSHTPTVRSCGK